MMRYLKQFFRNRLMKFINRRIPSAKTVTLAQRNIFILPAKPSLFFILMLFMMWLLSVNYQNSLGYALVFLLSSLYMVAILHTYKNLAGLTLSVNGVKSAFVGDNVTVNILLSRDNKHEYESVILSWPESTKQSVDLIEGQQVEVPLYLPVNQRGLFKPDRLLVETYFPIGLFRAWSWIDLDIEVIVYPKPLTNDISPLGLDVGEEEDNLVTTRQSRKEPGSEDYQGLKTYQLGDNLKHIAWKAYARGQGLYTKDYKAADSSVNHRWLDWNSFQGVATEERLSYLCFWVLQLTSQDKEFGLRLPGKEVTMGHGDEHQTQALVALALWGQ